MKYCIEYLVRVNIKSESLEEEWFSNEKSTHLLSTFVESALENIHYCGIHFKYLNYSAS